jgi:hypothetical protein
VEFWKFAHIAAMFVTVSIFVGQGMLEGVVARSGDVRALRTVLAAEERFTPIGGGIFLLGIVFGVVAALTGGFDLTQPWLILGYVLTAVILVLAFAYHAPTSNRLKALAAASTDDRPSAELQRAIDRPVARWMNVVDGLVWLGVIFVMVVKPFS